MGSQNTGNRVEELLSKSAQQWGPGEPSSHERAHDVGWLDEASGRRKRLPSRAS